jgi:hypothetical protein
MLAVIRHHYKAGGQRDSDRHFHPRCLERFEEQGARPSNPHTEYEVLSSEREVAA